MKAVTFQEPEVVRTEGISDPEIVGPRDAIVRVTMAGLCGSDLHPFFGREKGLYPGTVMGHEMVGIVESVGSEFSSSTINVGDKVFAPFTTNCGDCYYCKIGLTSRCPEGQLFGWRQKNASGEVVGLHGCQAELVSIPLADSTLKKLPAGVSEEAALLLGDNFSTGYYCAEMANVNSDGVYAVVGCGTVGQLAVVSALSMGARHVIAIDPVDSRRQQAEALGAVPAHPDSALSEIQARTQGRGADSVMELVGLPAAQKLAYDLIRPGGIMSVIGCHSSPGFAFRPSDAYDKNLTYRTGRCPARSYMDLLTDRVANGEFNLDPFITHRFSLQESVRAYEVFSQKLDNCTKAAFVP